MKTASELSIPVGMYADYCKIDGITFTVNIIDTRERFGQVDCLVVPVFGKGSAWVSIDSLKNIG